MNSIYKDGALQNVQTDNPYMTVRRSLDEASKEGMEATFTIVDSAGKVVQTYTNRIVWGTIIKPQIIGDDVESNKGVTSIKFDATYAILNLPYDTLVNLTDNSSEAIKLATQCTGTQSPFTVVLVNAIAEFFGVQKLSQISKDQFEFVVNTASRFADQFQQHGNSDFVDIETYIQEGTADWKFFISLELDTGEIKEARPEYSQSKDHSFEQTDLEPSENVEFIYKHYREQAIAILNSKKMTKKDWFIKLLDSTDCIRVDGGPLLTNWNFNPNEKNPDDVVLSLNWVDSEGLQYDEDFTSESLEKITVREDHAFIIENTVAERTVLQLFRLNKLAIPNHV